jgi:glycerol-3-phosphate dehydrogenase
MSEFRPDVTVVGGGVAGLWSAKEMIDRGLSVDVVEKTDYLANGATTRNEGWLHAGTYHAAAVYDETDARTVTERTVYGHDKILDFAPESVEHHQSYALFADAELAQSALARWIKFGIPYHEIPKSLLEDERVDLSRIEAAFAVRDKSVNSRVIVNKLANHITTNGGRIFTGADFIPTSETTADMIIGEERHTFTSDAFLVSAGTGTKKVFEALTGNPFPMRYFKSHLLVTPRLSRDNIFYMDPLEAGLMSHGDATIVGINREAVEVDIPDYEVLPEKAEMVRAALLRLVPHLGEAALSKAFLDIACIKADVADTSFMQRSTDPTMVLQDLNIKVFEPSEGWICAIPGKMTEAPALARAAADRVMSREFSRNGRLDKSEVAQRDQPKVNLRPADRWLAERMAA